MINELELNPEGSDFGNEWVELYNPTTKDLNLLAWNIETNARQRQTYQMDEVSLAAGGFLVIVFPSPFLNNIDESLNLIDRDGNRVDSTPILTDTLNDQRTWQRIPDGLDGVGVWHFISNTKGSSNFSAEPGTAPSLFCGLSTRIALGSSFAILAAIAAPTAMLVSLLRRKKKRDREELIPSYVYSFAVFFGFTAFLLWETMRIPELAQVEPLLNWVMGPIDGLAGGRGFLGLWRHGQTVRQRGVVQSTERRGRG